MNCDRTLDCQALTHHIDCDAVEHAINYRLDNRCRLDQGMGSSYDLCRNPDCRGNWHGTPRVGTAKPCMGSHLWNTDGTPREQDPPS